MVAIVVFMVIMLGGLNYFTIPHASLAREKMRRIATAAAEQRMETLMLLDYTDISADSNETNTPVVLEGRTGYRSTTVASVDDALDGTGGSDADGDTVDYKTISIDVSWSDGNSQNVTLTTKVSDFGSDR
jgi:hypothetical protein